MTRHLIFGGNSNNGANSGPFYVNSNWYPSNSNANVGASFFSCHVISSQMGKISSVSKRW